MHTEFLHLRIKALEKELEQKNQEIATLKAPELTVEAVSEDTKVRNTFYNACFRPLNQLQSVS